MARRWWGLTGLAIAALAVALPARAADAPRRIVSLNLCVDQILIDLVAKSRIAALTHLATDASVSAIPEAARGYPFTHGTAEEVIRLDPDLVISQAYSMPATVDLLRRLGRRVEVVPLPQTFADVRALVRRIAQLVGEEARGEALVRRFDDRLAAAAKAAQGQPQRTALIYQIGGLVSAAGTIVDEALEAAGFVNMAGRYTLTRSGRLPMEELVAHPPDLLVLATAPDDYPTAVADNLRHPVVRRIMRRHASVLLPWPLWLCGTPHIADAVERLAAARQALVPQGVQR
ncbi:MAG: ABC transporter substrate-binding protein [Hyphomicrobiaceae bacterium]